INSEASIETDVYFDSVAMFTFFLLLGRFMEMQTRHKHLNSDAEMGKLLPTTAIIRTEDGEKSKPAHQLEIGEVLVVRQGQVFPADGVVIEGVSKVDESALTGEFLPIEKALGAQVSGGTANVENTLFVRITATPKESRVAAIIKLLDKAASEKPKTVLMADKIASHFVAGVLFAACVVGLYWYFNNPDEVFTIVLSVLVVTCPCALSLATPTAMTSANTFLRSKGFLITKSHAQEAMNQITDIVFDKTG
ncbi:HAD-IC family P-type ATPase, partial [Oleiphilus sp. HI0061]